MVSFELDLLKVIVSKMLCLNSWKPLDPFFYEKSNSKIVSSLENMVNSSGLAQFCSQI